MIFNKFNNLTLVLNTYLEAMTEIVLKNDGTLDKFIGDAVMVYFGDPDSKGVKEDAIACVKMATEMKAKLVELNEEWINQGIDIPFNIRMGITTGYCTVGNFGSKQLMDYTIIGSQVNLASRLESASEPGNILISHPTYLFVKDIFNCEEKEPISAKGFSEPVKVYQIMNLH